ncbi:MAG: hypothetical protein JG764_798 [Clostridiales bacterium]|jgi:hypothetical protein|nr:hypothetical protein [Clostridiales bacterium]
MKLDKHEQSILATFPSDTWARKAVKELKKMGVISVSLDRVSKYGANNDTEYNNPIAGQAGTVTGLTLYSANTNYFSNNDERILRTSAPEVSGFGNKDYGIAGGEGFLVSVVVEDGKVDKALKIIKENNGTF